MKRQFIAILADDVPLAAAQIGGATTPCCVIENQRVLCADPNAEKLGIHPGMSQGTAIALSADLTLYPRHLATEQGLMQGLAQWAYRHSSWVHWNEDCLIVEVAGSEKLFGGLESLWQRLHSRTLRHIGRCRVALGPNPEAAVLLARLEWQTLDVNQAQEWLTKIPLTRLPLNAPLIQRLSAMGLNQIESLLAFSSADLARRFPVELKDYLDRLLGRKPDLRPTWTPQENFHSTLSLQQACHNAQALAFPIKHLLDQLANFLKTRQWSCLEFTLTFINEDRQQQPLTLALGQGLHRTEAMIEPLKLHLNKITLSAPVIDIQLTSDRFRVWRGETGDLMKPQPKDTQSELLIALQARLGKHALQGLNLAASWLPERANIQQAFGLDVKEPGVTYDNIRPTWLLPTPLPMAPHDLKTLQWLRGPERIEAHWWQDQGGRRDYHVASQSGALVWVFKDLRTQQWYLNGLFG